MATAGPDADLLAALRACRLWRSATDAALLRLAARAQVRVEPRGALLFSEGEAAERLGVVVEGRVRVFHLGADGRSITFESVGAGEPVAAFAALAGSRYPATAETATPATIAWIDRGDVLGLATDDAAVARDIIADLAGRVVDFTSVVTTLSLDVPARLARYLFHRALAAGTATPEGLVVDLGMTKTELAAALGTVPETLSRALGRLKEQDLVTVRAREVVIHDVGALARLGSGYEEG